jgi:predicted nucleic acid-binding protein
VTARRLVVNASPLILLAKIDALALFHRLAEEVVVPSAVVGEIQRGPGHSATSRELVARGEFLVEQGTRPMRQGGSFVERRTLIYGSRLPTGELVLRGDFRVEPDAAMPEEIAGWDLGRGESQVLTFALANPQWEAVLDDLEARQCGRSLGVPVTGTLGVILRSKQAGLIRAARPVVEELVRAGAYLARDLIDTALAKVGE